ncbi:MAG: DinB family protein, partial [Ignavibacteriaceae bacterium]
FAAEATIPIKALEGKLMLDQTPQAPNTVEELIAAYESSYKVLVERIKNTSEEDLNKTVKFPVAPKKMGDVRCIDLAWMMLLDMIHHRGQFSIYLRMAGGKVPSIYGPSADEPWM